MSNLGFRIAMEQAGIAMVETAVGDRYVLEAMKAGDYSLGGEQSGHLILLDRAPQRRRTDCPVAARSGCRDRASACRCKRGPAHAAGARQRAGRR